MNKAQRIVVMVGLAAVLLVVLFPPWRLSIDAKLGEEGITTLNGFLGCHFLFAERADIVKSVGARDTVSRIWSVLDPLGRSAERGGAATGVVSRWSTLSIDVPRLCLQLLTVAAATALLTILAGMRTKRRV